ncbi:MAG: hypothetical protein ACT4QF_15345 [Sporichthyaceae bacterium]
MKRALFASVLALTLCAGWPAANAATDSHLPRIGSVGYDISHPQCTKSLPSGGEFGIVGVNKGRSFTANPCLTRQYRWAEGRPHASGVYLNTGNPGAQSRNYWSDSGDRDPAKCVRAWSTRDAGCAYNYGWQAAKHAAKVALNAGVSLNRTWWLDVETGNSWVGSGVANTASLQGGFDYLRSRGVEEVGIYSVGHMWLKITDGYHADNAADYRAAWRPHFTPKYRLESAPLWQAGGRGYDGARARCAVSFTGGTVRLSQYVRNNLDHNVVCARPSASAVGQRCPAGTFCGDRGDVYGGPRTAGPSPGRTRAS